MSTPLRPLGHKIVVRPDAHPTETESGIYIPEAYQDVPAMSGTVLKVGTGAERDKKLRIAAIARCLSILHEACIEAPCPSEALTIAREDMERYLRDASEIGHYFEVGDRVIFPMEAGHEIVLNEDAAGAVVILSEDSVLAVYDAAEEAAA